MYFELKNKFYALFKDILKKFPKIILIIEKSLTNRLCSLLEYQSFKKLKYELNSELKIKRIYEVDATININKITIDEKDNIVMLLKNDNRKIIENYISFVRKYNKLNIQINNFHFIFVPNINELCLQIFEFNGLIGGVQLHSLEIPFSFVAPDLISFELNLFWKHLYLYGDIAELNNFSDLFLKSIPIHDPKITSYGKNAHIFKFLIKKYLATICKPFNETSHKILDEALNEHENFSEDFIKSN